MKSILVILMVSAMAIFSSCDGTKTDFLMGGLKNMGDSDSSGSDSSVAPSIEANFDSTLSELMNNPEVKNCVGDISSIFADVKNQCFSEGSVNLDARNGGSMMDPNGCPCQTFNDFMNPQCGSGAPYEVEIEMKMKFRGGHGVMSANSGEVWGYPVFDKQPERGGRERNGKKHPFWKNEDFSDVDLINWFEVEKGPKEFKPMDIENLIFAECTFKDPKEDTTIERIMAFNKKLADKLPEGCIAVTLVVEEEVVEEEPTTTDTTSTVTESTTTAETTTTVEETTSTETTSVVEESTTTTQTAEEGITETAGRTKYMKKKGGQKMGQMMEPGNGGMMNPNMMNGMKMGQNGYVASASAPVPMMGTVYGEKPEYGKCFENLLMPIVEKLNICGVDTTAILTFIKSSY